MKQQICCFWKLMRRKMKRKKGEKKIRDVIKCITVVLWRML